MTAFLVTMSVAYSLLVLGAWQLDKDYQRFRED